MRAFWSHRSRRERWTIIAGAALIGSTLIGRGAWHFSRWINDSVESIQILSHRADSLRTVIGALHAPEALADRRAMLESYRDRLIAGADTNQLRRSLVAHLEQLLDGGEFAYDSVYAHVDATLGPELRVLGASMTAETSLARLVDFLLEIEAGDAMIAVANLRVRGSPQVADSSLSDRLIVSMDFTALGYLSRSRSR